MEDVRRAADGMFGGGIGEALGAVRVGGLVRGQGLSPALLRGWRGRRRRDQGRQTAVGAVRAVARLRGESRHGTVLLAGGRSARRGAVLDVIAAGGAGGAGRNNPAEQEQ